MITTIAQAIPAVKYAAAMAISTGKPWGVYRGNKSLLVVMPTEGSKRKPIEVCHPLGASTTECSSAAGSCTFTCRPAV